MMLVEETTVLTEALPMEAFRAHLRLGSGFGEDSLQDSVLESFLRAAMSAVEARTGKILIVRDFRWVVTRWRDTVQQVFPVAPVFVITSVELADRMGGNVTVASSAYRLFEDTHAPRVVASGGSLPSIPTEGSATLRFQAGYGSSWQDVPADLGQAVLLLAAHYYEYRHETALQSGCMPFGVTSLLERYRPMRLTVGAGQ